MPEKTQPLHVGHFIEFSPYVFSFLFESFIWLFDDRGNPIDIVSRFTFVPDAIDVDLVDPLRVRSHFGQNVSFNEP